MRMHEYLDQLGLNKWPNNLCNFVATQELQHNCRVMRCCAQTGPPIQLFQLLAHNDDKNIDKSGGDKTMMSAIARLMSIQ